MSLSMLQAMHENAAVFRDGPTLQNGVKLVKEIWPEIMRGIKVCIRPALDVFYICIIIVFVIIPDALFGDVCFHFICLYICTLYCTLFFGNGGFNK